MLPIEPYEFSQSWFGYLERLEMNFDINSDTIDTPERKVSAFLVAIGSNAYGVLKHLTLPDDPTERTYEELVEYMTSYCDSRPKILNERYKFRERVQKRKETVQDFLASLQELSKECGYEFYHEEAVRDQFVFGLSSKGALKRLLFEEDVTLAKALDIATMFETLDRKPSKSRFTTDVRVDVDNFAAKLTMNEPVSTGLYPCLGAEAPLPEKNYGFSEDLGKMDSRSSVIKHGKRNTPCYRCDKTGHSPLHCKYKHAVCHQCNKKGHLTASCVNPLVPSQESNINMPSQPKYDSLDFVD